MRDHLIGKLDLDEKIFQEQFFFNYLAAQKIGLGVRLIRSEGAQEI